MDHQIRPCVVVCRGVEEDLSERLEGLRDGEHEGVELVLVLAEVDHEEAPQRRVEHGPAAHLRHRHGHAQERVVLCEQRSLL